jgi:hypothetical protein
LATKSLVPTPAEPKRSEIKQDRQRRRRFDHKSAESISDEIGCKPREDLMSTVEDGDDYCKLPAVFDYIPQ